jgi:hypothetical protein
MTFNVTSSREIMPDIEFFVDCIENSLAELKKAAAPPKKKRRKKKAAAKKKTIRAVKA